MLVHLCSLTEGKPARSEPKQIESLTLPYLIPSHRRLTNNKLLFNMPKFPHMLGIFKE